MGEATEEAILVILKLSYPLIWKSGKDCDHDGWADFLSPTGETGGDSEGLLAASRAGSVVSEGLRVFLTTLNSS